MAKFEASIGFILKNEGGFVNNPADPGGATNFGVSLRWLLKEGKINPEAMQHFDYNHDGHLDWHDVAAMTVNDAMEVYETYYWNPYQFEKIWNQSLATKIFDMSVNMGHFQAFKLAQRAFNDLRLFSVRGLVVDGMVGPATLQAINTADPTAYMYCLCQRQKGFYQQLVLIHPEFKQFEDGWMVRAALRP